MKPLSIADYLDRLGRTAGEKPLSRENSPFRPRSLPSPQTAASGAKPVFDRLADRVGARGLDPGAEFLMECLELGADLLLGLAGDLAPDPLPIGTVAERDRTHVPVPGSVQVDTVFAVAAAPVLCLGHDRSVTLWLPVWLPATLT